MSSIYRIKHMLRKDKLVKKHSSNNRYIPQKIYSKLKKVKNCKIYNSNKILQIHHIVPVRNGGQNVESNLIVICKKCHDKIHECVDDTFVIENQDQLLKTDGIGELQSQELLYLN